MRPRPLLEVLDSVGELLGPSEWRCLDADRLAMFAEATLMGADDGVDLTVANSNRLGPELIDGFLSLSLIMHFNWCLFPFRDRGTWALNYGFEKVRFPAPVYVDERVRATMEITSARPRERGGILVEARTELEIEDREKPAVVADWLCLYLDRAKGPSR
jgi:acyl dehydratase